MKWWLVVLALKGVSTITWEWFASLVRAAKLIITFCVCFSKKTTFQKSKIHRLVKMDLFPTAPASLETSLGRYGPVPCLLAARMGAMPFKFRYAKKVRFGFSKWLFYHIVQNRMQEFNEGSKISVTVEGVDELGPTWTGKLLVQISSPISRIFDFWKTAKTPFLVPCVDQAVADRTRLGNCLSPTVMSVCRARVTACNFMLALEQATISIKPVLDRFMILKVRRCLQSEHEVVSGCLGSKGS